MSELNHAFHTITNLRDLLTLPLNTFSAFEVRIHPTSTSAQFRKKLFQMLAHGRPISVNGKPPNLMATLFEAAGCEFLYNSIKSFIADNTDGFDNLDVYEEMLDSHLYEKEYIIRHAGENGRGGNADDMSMYIYTNIGEDNVGRRYTISYKNNPAQNLRPVIIINFEQASVRSLNIQSPPGANRDITTLIKMPMAYRPEDTPENKPQTVAMSAFYWSHDGKPSFLRTVLGDGTDNNVDPGYHQSYIPPELDFPVIHAIGKEWPYPRFLQERISALLINLAKHYPTLAEHFETVSLNKASTTPDRFTFTGVTHAFDETAVNNALGRFTQFVMVLPDVKGFTLSTNGMENHYDLLVDSPFLERSFLVKVVKAEG